MRFCPEHATCSLSFFTDFNVRWLSALSLSLFLCMTTISSGPPRKIREQLSLDYLILRQIPRIPPDRIILRAMQRGGMALGAILRDGCT